MQIFSILVRLLKHGEVCTFDNMANLDASLRRKGVLSEWIDKKVREGQGLLHLTERKLGEVNLLESEGQALKTLGENVL
jgi:hypothetical protein